VADFNVNSSRAIPPSAKDAGGKDSAKEDDNEFEDPDEFKADESWLNPLVPILQVAGLVNFAVQSVFGSDAPTPTPSPPARTPAPSVDSGAYSSNKQSPYSDFSSSNKQSFSDFFKSSYVDFATE